MRGSKKYLESDAAKAVMEYAITSAVKKAVDRRIAEGLEKLLMS